MPVKLDLPKDLAMTIGKTRLDALKRQRTSATNKLIQQALDDEISQISRAFDTITEIK